MLEAAELRKPGRLQFQLAVKLFAGGGRHTLEVAAVNPKGLPEPGGSVAHSFDVSNPAWGERFAVPISFPCEYVGWWTLRLTLDGAPLGETHLWVQFVPY